MRKIEYIGRWSVNNGNTYAYGYKDKNKKRLAKNMRDIAKGNTIHGSYGYWSIIEIVNGKIQENPILSGKVKG